MKKRSGMKKVKKGRVGVRKRKRGGNGQEEVGGNGAGKEGSILETLNVSCGSRTLPHFLTCLSF